MKISIALCTYNGSAYLQEQLESFLSQTRLPDELVIGDDCSSDNTIEIIEAFSKEAPFNVNLLVNKNNLGSSKNFETTIQRCKGDIIFLSDQDDIWMPGKISTIEKVFLNNPNIGLVFSDAELVNEQLEKLPDTLFHYTFPKSERDIFEKRHPLEVFVKQNVVTGATMAFRSAFVSELIPFTLTHHLIHDGWTSFFIATKTDLCFLTEQLIKYRQHSAQQIGAMMTARPNTSFEKSINLIPQDIERVLVLKESVATKRIQLSEHVKNKISEERLVHVLQDREKYLIEKREHYKVRDTLPDNFLKRASHIFSEVNTGRYKTYSKGIFSALKDLLRIKD